MRSTSFKSLKDSLSNLERETLKNETKRKQELNVWSFSLFENFARINWKQEAYSLTTVNPFIW